MIPLDLNEYVSTDYYGELNEREKEVYMRGVRDTIATQEKKLVKIYSQLLLGGFHMDISFVGMRYRGGHVFQASDVVKLEPEYLNERDAYAVKVLVEKDGRMQHVAYVTSDDARALRHYHGFERAHLQFIQHYPQTARYRITFPEPQVG
ncbi:hypothetical protein EDD11_001293 [Mortierella claussenii]|nr:hypothetical protein EDD11_001293 [Mortierella claussenii]